MGIVWPDKEPVQESTCLDFNLLRSAAEQPYQECFGRELYPSLAAKAAYIFVHIAGGHIFTNGNKRTGVLCLDNFLLGNSRYLTLSNKDMQGMAEWVATAGERGIPFSDRLAVVTRLIEENVVSINSLRKIDIEMYRYALRQKRWIRTDPLNQRDAPLAQPECG